MSGFAERTDRNGNVTDLPSRTGGDEGHSRGITRELRAFTHVTTAFGAVGEIW